MSTEILIGKDQLQKLEAVAEAASDLKLAHGDAEFARLNGGTEKLLRDLCEGLRMGVLHVVNQRRLAVGSRPRENGTGERES